jgi:hypothetical protein
MHDELLVAPPSVAGVPVPDEEEVVPPHALTTPMTALTVSAMVTVRGELIGEEPTRERARCRERSSLGRAERGLALQPGLDAR